MHEWSVMASAVEIALDQTRQQGASLGGTGVRNMVVCSLLEKVKAASKAAATYHFAAYPVEAMYLLFT